MFFLSESTIWTLWDGGGGRCDEVSCVLDTSVRHMNLNDIWKY